MRGRWAEAADAMIYKINEEFSATATLKERKAALRAHASEFHMGTSWGKKVWARRSRAYLEQHGLPHLESKAQPRKPSEWARRMDVREKQAKMLSADIVFPFRKEEGKP
jgi:hypothetical protein